MTYYYYLDCCLALFWASTACSKVAYFIAFSNFDNIWEKQMTKNPPRCQGGLGRKKICSQYQNQSREFVRIRRGNNSFKVVVPCAIQKKLNNGLVEFSFYFLTLNALYLVLYLYLVLVLVVETVNGNFCPVAKLQASWVA